jgi:hypothetical protein
VSQAWNKRREQKRILAGGVTTIRHENYENNPIRPGTVLRNDICEVLVQVQEQVDQIGYQFHDLLSFYEYSDFGSLSSTPQLSAGHADFRSLDVNGRRLYSAFPPGFYSAQPLTCRKKNKTSDHPHS